MIYILILSRAWFPCNRRRLDRGFSNLIPATIAAGIMFPVCKYLCPIIHVRIPAIAVCTNITQSDENQSLCINYKSMVEIDSQFTCNIDSFPKYIFAMHYPAYEIYLEIYKISKKRTLKIKFMFNSYDLYICLEFGIHNHSIRMKRFRNSHSPTFPSSNRSK